MGCPSLGQMSAHIHLKLYSSSNLPDSGQRLYVICWRQEPPQTSGLGLRLGLECVWMGIGHLQGTTRSMPPSMGRNVGRQFPPDTFVQLLMTYYCCCYFFFYIPTTVSPPFSPPIPPSPLCPTHPLPLIFYSETGRAPVDINQNMTHQVSIRLGNSPHFKTGQRTQYE